jgi:hypothetical protein
MMMVVVVVVVVVTVVPCLNKHTTHRLAHATCFYFLRA